MLKKLLERAKTLTEWQIECKQIAVANGFAWKSHKQRKHDFAKKINSLVAQCIRGWREQRAKYPDYDTFVNEFVKPRIDVILEDLPHEIDTVLLRLHSEITEASEALRDEDREHFAEELADVFIRLADCAESMDIDLEKEVTTKCKKNKNRTKLHGRKRA